MLRKFVSYDKGFTHKECLQINKEQKCYNKTKGKRQGPAICKGINTNS